MVVLLEDSTQRNSGALSGWMESVAAQLFSGLSRDVRLGSSLGSGWDTQGHSETFSEATLGMAVCLGLLSCWEGEPSPQSEVLSALEHVFIMDFSVLCLNPD